MGTAIKVIYRRETKSAIMDDLRLRNTTEITVITRSAGFKYLAAKLAAMLVKNSRKTSHPLQVYRIKCTREILRIVSFLISIRK